MNLEPLMLLVIGLNVAFMTLIMIIGESEIIRLEREIDVVVEELIKLKQEVEKRKWEYGHNLPNFNKFRSLYII